MINLILTLNQIILFFIFVNEDIVVEILKIIILCTVDFKRKQ